MQLPKLTFLLRERGLHDHAEPFCLPDFVTDITKLRAPSPTSEKLFAHGRCRMKWIARVWPYALVAISLIGLVYMALAGRF